MTNKTKKGSDFEIDDFSFEMDHDLDFNFNGIDQQKAPQIKKGSREAVVDVSRNIGSGMVDELKSPSFFKSLIRKSLPREYGNAVDFVDTSVSSAHDVYNQAAKDAKPAIQQAKRTTAKILPTIKGKIPKGLHDKLDSWSKALEETNRQQSEADQRETSLQMTLAGIFTEQAKDQVSRDNEQQAKTAINEALGKQRHVDLVGQLDAIRISTQQLSNYQDRIGSQFQKRSLEMQYRHYFVAVDTLAELKKLAVTSTTNLEAITHNTALPEIQKIKKSESLKEHMRNRFVGGVTDSVLGARGEFLKKFTERIGNTIKSSIRDFADSASNAMSGAEQLHDTLESTKEMGINVSAKDIAAQMAGASLVQKGGEIAGKFIKKHTGSTKGVRKVGAQAGYLTENAPQLIKKWSRSDIGDNLPLIGGLIRMAKDSVPSLKPGMSVEVDNTAKAQEPSIFTNATRKSITEIIPGFLARIYQELQIIRTGNPDVEITNYDYDSNKFASQSSINKKIFSKLIDRQDVKRTQQDGMNLVSMIDSKNELSTKEKVILARALLQGNLDGKLADPASLAQAHNYTGEAAKHSKKFANLFQREFAVKDGKIGSDPSFHEKRLKFSRDYNNLGWSFKGNNELLQHYVNTGNYEALRDMGFLNEDNRVDQSRIEKYYGGMSVNYATNLDNKRKFGNNRVTKEALTGNINPGNNISNATSNIQQQHIGFDDEEWRKEVTDNQQSIISAINNSSTVETNKNIFTLLQEMKEIMLNQSFGGNNANGDNGKLSFMQRSVGSVIKGGISGGFGLLKKGFNFGLSSTKRAFNLGSTLAGKSLSGIKNAKNWLFDKSKAIDLYVRGEVEPRLLAWKLQAGKYRDKITGKVITKFEEIKGELIDEDGNLVLSMEDLKNLIIPSGDSRIMKTISKLKDLAVGGINLGLSTSKSFYGISWNLGRKAFSFIRTRLRQGDDVYVGEETSPRLTAIVMRSGGYFSARTNKNIWRGSDIDGNVKDSEGKILISEDDLRKGIHDANGKPFKTLLRSVVDKVKGTVKGAWNLATGILKKGTDIVKGGLEGIVGKFVGKDGIVFAGSKKLTNYVKEIRDILDSRLPKKKHVIGDIHGDGIREGSAEDLDRKRAAKEGLGNIADQVKNATSKAGTGIAGLTMAGLSKLKNLFSKKKGEEGKDKEPEGKGFLSKALDAGVEGLDVYSDYKLIKAAKGVGAAEKAAEVAGAAAKQTKWGKLLNLGGKGLRYGTDAVKWGGRMIGKIPGMKYAGDALKSGYGAVKGYGAQALNTGKGYIAQGLGKIGLGGLAGAEAANLGAGGLGASELATGANVAKGAATAGRLGAGLATGGLALGGIAADYAGDKIGTDRRVGAVTSVGGSALTGAALGATVGSVIPVVGTAVGGVVGGVLGGAYGVYRNWNNLKFGMSDIFGKDASIKKFLWGHRGEDGAITNLRMAQYGFLSTDKDQISRVRKLEELVIDKVKFNNGSMSIDLKDLDAGDVLDLFDIKKNDKPSIAKFGNWFKGRFKPVLTKYMEAINNIKPNTKIADLDTLEDDLKLRLLDSITVSDNIYSITASPFNGNSTLKADANTVQNNLAIAKKGLKDKPRDPKVAQLAAAVTAGITSINNATKLDKPKSVITPQEIATELDKAIKAKTELNKTRQMATIGGDSNVLSFSDAVRKSLLPLDAVKYKAYGLVNFELSKIQSLNRLESVVANDIKLGPNGAIWKGSIERVCRVVGPMFGIIDINTEDGTQFAIWFNNRFMPVYQAMATAVMKLTNKSTVASALQSLDPNKHLDVATVIYTAKNGLNQSIWNVDASPWPKYKLNTDKDSVQDTLSAIRNSIKAEIVPEKTTVIDRRTEDEKKANKLAATAKANNIANAANNSPNWFNRITDKLSNSWDKTTKLVGDTYTVGKQFASDTYDTSKKKISSAFNSAKDYLGLGDRSKVGGSAIAGATGDGAGGKVDQLPDPKANNYAGMKDMIHAAANMVGVDPMLLAVMTGIESNFNPSARPSKGGATGLLQFINTTWTNTIKKYGGKYGITAAADRLNPKANILMGAEYLKENYKLLKSAIGREVTQADIYLAHFLGPAGAIKLIKSDPSQIAASVFPKEATYNGSVFYKKDSTPRTIGEIYQWAVSRINDVSRTNGIPISGGGSNGSAGGISTVSKADSNKVTPITSSAKNMPDAAKSGEVANVPVTPKSPLAANILAGKSPTTTSTNIVPINSGAQYARSIDSSTEVVNAPVKQRTTPLPDISPGYNTSVRNVSTQSNETSNAFNNSIGNVDSTLQKSLQVQQSQLEVLTKIHTAIISNKGNVAQQSNATNESVKQTQEEDTSIKNKPFVEKVPQKARAVPLSMKKAS